MPQREELNTNNAALRSKPTMPQEFKADNAALREELNTNYAALREEFNADNAALREQQRADYAALREEQRADYATLRQDQRSDYALLREDLKAVEAKVDAGNQRLARLEGIILSRDRLVDAITDADPTN